MTPTEALELVAKLRELGGHGFPNWADDAADAIAALARALAEARKVKPLTWDHDGRRFHMDDTMHFSSAYDWDGYELMRQEGYGAGYGYIIWPDRIAGESWNLYGTADGLYVQDLKGEEAAKAAAEADHAARVLAQLEGQA